MTIKNLSVKLENVIYLWAGVENIDDSAMRGLFSAKKLSALEEFRGEDFDAFRGQTGDLDRENVQTWQIQGVTEAWNSFFGGMMVKFLPFTEKFKEVFAKEVEEIIPQRTVEITNEDGTVSNHIVPEEVVIKKLYPTYNFKTDNVEFNGVTFDEILANFEFELNNISNNSSTASDETVRNSINDLYKLSDQANFKQEVQNLLQNISLSEIPTLINNSNIRKNLNDFSFDSLKNTVIGSEGDDRLSSGDALIYSSENNDDITNDDVIIGKKGDDYLYAKSGNDTYIYNLGDGKDVIDESGRRGFYTEEQMDEDNGVDTILFGAGIKREDVYIFGDSDNPTIKFKNSPNDQIQIKYQYLTANRVEKLLFADGNEIDLTDPNLTFSFFGEDNGNNLQDSEIILGSNNSDIIDSRKGLDFLHGSDGDDTYLYKRGDGTKVISEFGVLRDYEDIFNSGSIQNTSYFWNGTSPALKTYDLGNDTIEFEFGIREEDIYFAGYTGDILISFRDNPDDRILLKNQLSDGAANKIENLKFSYQKTDENDNLLFDEITNEPIIEEKIIDLISKDWDNQEFEINAGSNDDEIYINGGNGYIVRSGAGNDDISGNVNNVEIYAEEGNDVVTIFSNEGSNKIDGGAGNDNLFSGIGEDILIGGKGDDILKGDKGNDTYLYSLGDGSDVIEDYYDAPGTYNGNGGSQDKISFSSEIKKENLIITRNNINLYDLLINFKDEEGNQIEDDQIRIKNFFKRNYYQIENLEFSHLNEGHC